MGAEKNVFDRALEFLGWKWLERNGVQGYAPKSVHAKADTPPASAGGVEDGA